MSRNFTPDETLIDRLLLDDTEAFEELHRRYCFSLYRYCNEKLNSPEDARRITRDLFIYIWENRHRLPVNFSVSLHFYTEVRKAVVRCVNEKLLDQMNIPVIEDKIIPEFRVDQLQKARQPVKNNNRIATDEVATKTETEIPWWNYYPTIPQMKKIKNAFWNMMNLF